MRPFPALGIITYVDAIGEAKSQGVDLSMNLNYAPKRIFGAVNYRLAKAMNDGDSATSLPMNGSDLDAEWGPARNDVRHRIFGFVSTPLKFGLRTNLNMRYESGVPYNVTTGFDDNGDDVSNDRPDGVGRNSARGEGLLNIDLRLSWQKSIGQPKGGDQGPGGPGGGPVIIRAPGGGPGGGGGGRGPGGGGGGGGFGGGFGPGANSGRVNLEIFAQVSNLTNTVNYRSYSTRADVEVLRPAAVVGRAPPHRARLPRRLLGARTLRAGSRTFQRGPGPRPGAPLVFWAVRAVPRNTALAAAPAVAHNATGSSTPGRSSACPSSPPAPCVGPVSSSPSP